MRSVSPHRRRQGWGGLRGRIVAWSFVPTAVILFAVALVAIRAYGSVTEQQAIQTNQELARLSAANLATEIEEFALDLASLARQTDIIAPDDRVREAALQSAANRLAVFDEGAVILDVQGRVAAAWPRRPEDLGRDWSSRPYFVRLLGSSQTVFSDITEDGRSGTSVIAVATPIVTPAGEFNGVLLGMFRLGATSVSALYGDIAKLRVGVSGDVYVVDGNARVIQHPDPSLIGVDLSSQIEVRDVVSGESGAIRTRDRSGRDVVAGYAPVPGTSWGLVAVESWDALIRPTQGYRTFLLVLLALGLFIPALVVALGVRRIIRPVTALTVAARRVAAGNFEKPVVVETKDELQELAEQFNEMAGRLRMSYDELDSRVAARTRELATLNAVASVVSQSLDLDRILDDALAKIMDDLGFEAGAAFILADVDDTARLVTGKNLPASTLEALSAPVAKSLRPTPDPDDKPTSLILGNEDGNGQWQKIREEGWRAVVQIPVGAKGRVFGDLILLSKEEVELGPEQLIPLSSIGNQIGMAVENARLFERAEESAAAAERNRLARDLHDAVSQTLFSASLIADVLPRLYQLDPEEGQERLEELRQLTRGALAEMRTLLLELRPAALADAKLDELLRQLSESVIGRARIPVQLEAESCEDVPSEVRHAFYRVAQEALNNVTKHSSATNVRVVLTRRTGGGPDDGTCGLELVVEDNGVGFEPGGVAPGSLGLGIMFERTQAIGAELSVTSSPGKGTRVLAVWPGPERANAEMLEDTKPM